MFRLQEGVLMTSIDIVSVLLGVSALVGAAAGLRLKALALVPIALLIAVLWAVVLHKIGFGPGSGIGVIIASLILNQGAYVLVQILSPGLASRSLNHVKHVIHARSGGRV